MMKTFIIAEAGVNHNGDLKLAHDLIDVAVKSGADAVKFQTFKANKTVTENAPKAQYQNETTGEGGQFAMLKSLELDQENHLELIEHCKESNIFFCSTPFDIESADFLDSLDVPFFKIPSGEVTNLPFLEHIASKDRPIILSTGMSTMEEVQLAVKWLSRDGSNDESYLPALSVLHCVTSYPTPTEDTNLMCISSMANQLEVPIGYSDHSLGLTAPVAAVALGATIIEKHLTLDKNLPGPDHRASAEPDEFYQMVSAIREVEQALGNGMKQPAPCELPNIPIVRRSIVAAYSITKGETITAEMLDTKRPGTGISPTDWYEVIGRKAIKNFAADDLIEL